MSYLLLTHPKTYDVSTCEAIFFPIMSPYADRHDYLAVNGPVEHRCGHKTIAWIQTVPLVCFFASLIERIIAYIYIWFHGQAENNIALIAPLREYTIAPYPSPPRHFHPRLPSSALKLEETEEALEAKSPKSPLTPLSPIPPSPQQSSPPRTPSPKRTSAVPATPIKSTQNPSTEISPIVTSDATTAATPEVSFNVTPPPENEPSPASLSSEFRGMPLPYEPIRPEPPPLPIPTTPAIDPTSNVPTQTTPSPFTTPTKPSPGTSFFTPQSAIRASGCAPLTPPLTPPDTDKTTFPTLEALLSPKFVPIAADHSTLSVEAQKALLASTRLAIEEHLERETKGAAHMAEVTDAALPDTFEPWFKKATPLDYVHHSSSEKGSRSTQEDAQFYYEDEHSIITGIFDGHRGVAFVKGEDASNYASDNFVSTFFEKMKTAGSVTAAMQQTVNALQETVDPTVRLNAGATAIVVHIDKKTNIAIFGVLGDCAAIIYFMVNGQLKCLPVSRLHDWLSPREIARANGLLFFNPLNAGQEKNPKFWRYDNPGGPNFSRSIMDSRYEGLSHEMEFTAFQLQPEFLLTLGSDGLFDFVKHQQIIATIKEDVNADIADKLMMVSLANQQTSKDKDNVTVTTILCRSG